MTELQVELPHLFQDATPHKTTASHHQPGLTQPDHGIVTGESYDSVSLMHGLALFQLHQYQRCFTYLESYHTDQLKAFTTQSSQRGQSKKRLSTVELFLKYYAKYLFIQKQRLEWRQLGDDALELVPSDPPIPSGSPFISWISQVLIINFFRKYSTEKYQKNKG